MPLGPVREYLDMCDATRRSLSPADRAAAAEWTETFRRTLTETYELDLTDPTVVAAVAAGVVEGLGAAIKHGRPDHAMLAAGWALHDIAVGTQSNTSARCMDALGCSSFVSPNQEVRS